MSTITVLVQHFIKYILAVFKSPRRNNTEKIPSSGRWDLQGLEQKRFITDPIADNLIQTFNTPDDLNASRALFHQLICNSSPIPADLPDQVEQYFHDTRALPSWADPAKMHLAQQIFGRYGPEIVLALFCKSLPLAYACWRGAHVLTRTGRMTEQSTTDFTRLNRRIMETAQFVMNVMAPNGFGAQGQAIETVQKVRLIHASIRYYLGASQEWDTKLRGKPINQEDMAGTLMSFSICTLQALEQLGIELSSAEKEAYVHHWNVIGYLMGLDADLLPDNATQAEELMSLILQHQAGPSADGHLLMSSLLNYLASLIKVDLFDDYPHFMVQHLVGDQIANDLGVKIQHKPLWLLTTQFLKILNERYDKAEDASLLLQKLSSLISRKLLQSLINSHNDYKKIDFFIPPSLQKDWNIN